MQKGEKKIPTAERFFFDYSVDSEYDNVSPNCKQEIAYKAIQFAKLHVEAALKAASEFADLHPESNCYYEGGYCSKTRVDEKSILNAYPLTNII